MIFIALHIFTLYLVFNLIDGIRVAFNRIDKTAVPSCDVYIISELDESELGVKFGNPNPNENEDIYIPTCSGVCNLKEIPFHSCLFAIDENGIIDNCEEFTISSDESKTQCVCCN